MITTVIVTYNSEACIGTCIAALSQWLPDTETLVVDNASVDGSGTTAERHGARVIALPENIGFGRACNLGVRHAANDHILFLNPDVAIASAEATALAASLKSRDLGLTVPKAMASTFMFKERGWPHDALSLTFGALRPRELPRPSPSGYSSQALWASGAVLLVRRSEFLAIGGFDPRFFLYYEDRDLSWRYREAGLPVRSTTALAADHVGGGSSDVDGDRSDILAFGILGWLQYVANVYGIETAARAWRLARGMHTTVERSVGAVSALTMTDRLRRKDAQLKRVAEKLRAVHASSGVLEQSDGHAYWPDAVALLG